LFVKREIVSLLIQSLQAVDDNQRIIRRTAEAFNNMSRADVVRGINDDGTVKSLRVEMDLSRFGQEAELNKLQL